MALSDLDRKYDAVMAAVTGPGGRVILDKDEQGRTIVANFPATLPLFFIARMEGGGWLRFWTIFGASNQLLAALTLLSVATWLHARGRRFAFALLPMLFVLATTLWALGSLRHARRDPEFPWGPRRPKLPRSEVWRSALGSLLAARDGAAIRRLCAAAG